MAMSGVIPFRPKRKGRRLIANPKRHNALRKRLELRLRHKLRALVPQSKKCVKLSVKRSAEQDFREIDMLLELIIDQLDGLSAALKLYEQSRS